MASNRLLSLDVLRGLTVAGMILVNNGPLPKFATLQHAVWNGLTPCDLVFPFFLFMVGVSIYISLSRHAGEPGMVKKILKRSLLMFIIGVALHAWDMVVNGNGADLAEKLRIWGVLQRIALCYCAAALFFNYFKGKYLWHTIISLLVLYTVILLVGNGYSENLSENWIGQVDSNLFGKHIYHRVLKGLSPVDPEGLVGVIPGIAHCMIGVVCGRAIINKNADITQRIMKILLIAMGMGIVGYLISFGLPLNKRIWSPSYTLVTCSMAAGLLGLFTYIIDVKGHQDWCRLFQMFGMNALGIYTISEMIPAVFNVSGINDALYEFWSNVFCWTIPEVASLALALTYVALMSLLAWALFKKNIYIKI